MIIHSKTTIKLSNKIKTITPTKLETLNLTTVNDAIELAKMISFSDWMDATNASGYWPESQMNHYAEFAYRKLNAKNEPVLSKFHTAAQVLKEKEIIVQLAN